MSSRLTEMMARGLPAPPGTSTPPRTMSSRSESSSGEWPRMIGAWSTLSIGGRPCAAALLSVGSTPAREAKVPSQSAVAMSAALLAPRLLGGRNPPLMNDATRTPPSRLLQSASAATILRSGAFGQQSYRMVTRLTRTSLP